MDTLIDQDAGHSDSNCDGVNSYFLWRYEKET